MSNWQKSLASKNVDKIKSALQKMWRSEDRNSAFNVVNPTEFITINDFSEEQEVSIVEVLLRSNNLGQDAEFFDIAKELLRRGAPMPVPRCIKEKFSSVSKYLHHLADNPHDLFIALHYDPGIVNLQGEDGKTILHHAARIGTVMGSNSASLIHQQLFNLPWANFNIQDHDGNTPVHIAALNCGDRVTCGYTFPNYVRVAAQNGFNFDTLNQDGQAVIHIATRTAYARWSIGRYNTVAKLLNNAGENFNIDVLSSSGSTAFFYAINWGHLEEAHTLLSAGANPAKFGAPDRDPCKMIDELINQEKTRTNLIKASQSNTLSEYLANPSNKELIVISYKADYDLLEAEEEPSSEEILEHAEYIAGSLSENKETLLETLESLESLKQRMQSIVFTKAQEGLNKFPFWARTEESKQWDAVDTYIYDEGRSGPGYGF